MRIYSDMLTAEKVEAALLDVRRCGVVSDVYLDEQRSVLGRRGRRRDHSHSVFLEGNGARHTRQRNWGTTQYRGTGVLAATWMDWGWFIATMFRHDPHAVIGQYDGRDDFHAQTLAMIPSRLRLDRSVKNFARDHAALWPNQHSDPDRVATHSPFVLVDLIIPAHYLMPLASAVAFEAWLLREAS